MAYESGGWASGAVFSDDDVYRYILWRNWDGQKPYAAFVMLNPSTAGADVDDPTIRRVAGFTRAWGHYGGFVVVNLFGFRATDPRALGGTLDPVGPENDKFIDSVVSRPQCGLVIAAWGQHGALHGRAATVSRRIRELGRFCSPCVGLHTLRVNAGGQPAHPLYLPASLYPTPWSAENV